MIITNANNNNQLMIHEES